MAALNAARHLDTRLRWWLRWALRQRATGPLLLLLAYAVLALSWGWRQQARADEARLAAAGAAAPRLAPVSMDDTPVQRRRRLAAFYEQLPTEADLPATLASLFDLAGRRGLVLARGSYRLERDADAPLLRYHMATPLRGDPAQVQAVIAEALAAHPGLAIEAVQYRRDAGNANGNAPGFEARVQWLLYLRAVSGGAPVAAAAAEPAASRSAP